MLGALGLIGIALVGPVPIPPQPAPPPRIVKRGPRLSARAVTGNHWEPIPEDLTKMRKLIDVTPDDDPQKPDFWFRLGGTYLRFWEQTAGSAPGPDLQRAQAYFAKADDAFREALAFTNYDRTDGTLFQLARMHLAAEDEERARVYVDRLFREYPVSRYVPKVAILYGDYLFLQNELAAALAWYSAAAQANDPFTEAYAYYGKGWCFLKRGEIEAARDALAEAVRASQRMPPWGWNRTIGHEAGRDLAAIGGPPTGAASGRP
jgi:tetratricopeptide (TPR) repeat protein